MTLITADQFKNICPTMHLVRVNHLAEIINRVCPQYGINTKNIFHEFFATLCEECNEFRTYEENLNYSAKRLVQVWPKRFLTIASAIPYAMNPKALAMKVYGVRKNLGNLTREDGFIFRGSGPIQMTGRANVTNFGKWMEKRFGIKRTPEQWAELLRTNDEYGMHSACWIFAIAKQLIDEAERDEMITITQRINGGLTNLHKRLMYYELAKKYVV